MSLVRLQEGDQTDVGVWSSGGRRKADHGGVERLRGMHRLELLELPMTQTVARL